MLLLEMRSFDTETVRISFGTWMTRGVPTVSVTTPRSRLRSIQPQTSVSVYPNPVCQPVDENARNSVAVSQLGVLKEICVGHRGIFFSDIFRYDRTYDSDSVPPRSGD